MPRLNQLGSGVSSAEQTLQEINQRLESAESNLGEGGAMQQPVGSGNLFQLSDGYYTSQRPALDLLQRPLSLAGPTTQLPSVQTPKPFFGNANMPSELGPALSPISSAMRNMAAGGGMMGRQMYGLGSLVKSVTKGVKSAVKGVAKTVKKNPMLALAALNFAPMLVKGGASTFLGGKNAMFGLPSLFGTGKAIGPAGKYGTDKGLFGSVKNFFTGGSDLANTAKIFAGGSLLGGLLNQAEEEGDPEGITRDVGALRSKLINAYKNQRTFSDAADEDAAILEQVEIDLSEYNQDMNRANVAYGGRMSFARGPDNPEQNAIQAAGIMNLPLNQNPAGVTELDLRETGGFIPPVGVKEKADDIPAMLANNEFVFTADAVRGMGEGDVNKGAQRMYDMMKKLEKGGRV